MLSLASLFKKPTAKKSNSYKKYDAKYFEENFYNPKPSSPRIKRKKTNPTIKTSKGEALIIAYLKSKNISFEREKEMSNLVGRTGVNLRIDFYIKDLRTAIEFDGKQHFFASKKFDTPTCTLQTRQENDRNKDLFCCSKGIDMIRISYKEMKRIDDILDNKLNNRACHN